MNPHCKFLQSCYKQLFFLKYSDQKVSQSPIASKISNSKKCFHYYTSSFIGFFSGATADHKGSIRRHPGKQTQSCCFLKLCFRHGCSTALWISSLVFLAKLYHLHILSANLQLHDLFAWLISLNSKGRTLGASNCSSQNLWGVTPNQEPLLPPQPKQWSSPKNGPPTPQSQDYL